MERKETGRRGEQIALQYLQEQGCRILATNYRVGRMGEIDLIAVRQGRLHFIEVKTRTGYGYGTPAEAVNYKKQKTIRQVAACFLKANGAVEMPVQFDVIEVMLTKDGQTREIRYLQEVF